MGDWLESPFKSNILNGRVAMITGGGTGICFGIAKSMGLHGAKIAIMSRRLSVLQNACQELQKLGITAFAAQGDVRKPELCVTAVESVVKHFGKLDILVNGAAGNFICSAEDISTNGFKTVIDIDLIGTFNMCKAALPHLKKSTEGNIINISATLQYKPMFYQMHAAAAKAGVDVITKDLALEWAEYGIRVNSIAPGPIAKTAGMDRLSLPGMVKHKSGDVPIRMGTTQEIGQTALFLMTNKYITGEIVVVDGGTTFMTGSTSIPKSVYQNFQKESKKRQQQQRRSKL